MSAVRPSLWNQMILFFPFGHLCMCSSDSLERGRRPYTYHWVPFFVSRCKKRVFHSVRWQVFGERNEVCPGSRPHAQDSPAPVFRVPDHNPLRVAVGHFHTAVRLRVAARSPVGLGQADRLLVGCHAVEVMDRGEDEVSDSGPIDR